MSICVSLWNEMIDSMGHVLVEAARSNSVIVAKRLAIKSFQGVSLAFKNSSSFAINPPIEATE
ncbi:hypothetical protein LIER_41400 [Lithospermum erythrorhizon]|uniref:Uncharacterized protein n=1 Tax=Lithospermum erythrorhizon TaxID=34254 RepID=A0AAV3RA79_LITER